MQSIRKDNKGCQFFFIHADMNILVSRLIRLQRENKICLNCQVRLVNHIIGKGGMCLKTVKTVTVFVLAGYQVHLPTKSNNAVLRYFRAYCISLIKYRSCRVNNRRGGMRFYFHQMVDPYLVLIDPPAPCFCSPAPFQPTDTVPFAE